MSPPIRDGNITVAPTNIKAVDDIAWFTWKFALAALVVTVGACSRVAAAIPGMSVREMVDYSSKRAIQYIMGNIIAVLLSLESGFFDGLSESLWPEPPRRFHLGVRTLAYIYLAYRYGVLTWCTSQFPRHVMGNVTSCWARFALLSKRDQSPPPAGSSTTRKINRAPNSNNGGSEHPSDYDDDPCMGVWRL